MKITAILIIYLSIPMNLLAQLQSAMKVEALADTSIVAVNGHTDNPMALAGYFETKSNDGVAVKGVANVDDHGHATGGHFISTSRDGTGVLGEALYEGNLAQTFGGVFKSRADNSFGIWATSSDGDNSFAVFGEANGDNAHGVSGYSSGDVGIGVYGEARSSLETRNYAGYFYQESVGTIDDTGGGYGIYAESKVINCLLCGVGVYGTSRGKGVVGIATGSPSASRYQVVGVTGLSTQGVGVQGEGVTFDFAATGSGIDWHSSSSGRWKTNIAPITDPIDKLEQLSGVTFTWDEEHGGHEDIGFIAEEVGGILPQIVGYEENGIDATGMDYSRMTALLVEATKAMRVEYMDLIGALRSEINSYKLEIEHLKKKTP